jgi:MerR family transcriptional regulator, heat shock protein HspR
MTTLGPDTRPRYSISVAAELTGLHQQTLRVYEARGLVRPRRTPGGTRRYSEADLARLRKISVLTGELGLSLAGATRVLELEDMVARLDAQVADLQKQLVAASRHMRSEVARVHRSYRRDLVPYQPPNPPTIWTSRNSP